MLEIVGTGGCGGITAPAAGTPFLIPIPPKIGAKIRLDSVQYTPAGTAHKLTVLRPLGKTTVASTAAAGQAVINFTADPGAAVSNAIAANDFVVIRRAADGIYYAFTVSSVATLAITMTTNIGSGVGLAAGDVVWFYGVAADTDPLNNGLAHPNYVLTASTAMNITNSNGNGFISSNKMNEPVLVHIDNITAAGVFNRMSWLYTYEPGSSIGTVLPQGAEHAGDHEDFLGLGGVKIGDILKSIPVAQLEDILLAGIKQWLGGLGGETPGLKAKPKKR